MYNCSCTYQEPTTLFNIFFLVKNLFLIWNYLSFQLFYQKNIPNKMDIAPIYPFSPFSFIIIIEYTCVFPFSKNRKLVTLKTIFCTCTYIGMLEMNTHRIWSSKTRLCLFPHMNREKKNNNKKNDFLYFILL